MDSEEKEIQDMLNFDPLDTAEKLTGESYKGNDAVSFLGMGMGIAHNKKKKDMLTNAKDTYHQMAIKDYIDVIEGIGFSLVLRVPFVSRWKEDDTFFMFWREDGILLEFDTFHGATVNGGKFYYNWKPHNHKEYYHCISSGGFVKDSGEWAGYHDCREAVRHHISLLEKYGSFIKPWIKPPFMHLTHHGDNDKQGRGPDNWWEISRDRILMIPKISQVIMFPGGVEKHFNQYNR